jgi:DNA modification methylase
VFGTKRIPFVKDRRKGISNYWRIDTFRSQVENLKAAFPVELPARAIDLSTEEGDLVADCFGGSGSTMIAAEKRKRKCLLMEVDPSYCDLIVSRYIMFCAKNKIPVTIKRNGQVVEWPVPLN